MALKYASNSLNVVWHRINLSKNGFIHYLRNLRSHPMVLAPEGNGFDTHRLWETLYMGGTPVIISNRYLPKEILKLPVVILNSWEELEDLELVEQLWNLAQERRNSSFEFLKFSHWRSHILRSVP